MTNSEFSFHCSACGKCCNSPPQAALPELFQHQQRFIGCLTVRRMPAAQTRDTDALFRRVLHPVSSGREWIQLATQAYDDQRERCPALADDGRCALHHDRKPAVCAVVPLEAWLPDSAQAGILRTRRQQAGRRRPAHCRSSTNSESSTTRPRERSPEDGATSNRRSECGAARSHPSLERALTAPLASARTPPADVAEIEASLGADASPFK
ncbi:MAG TPA: hypothetical protein VK524_30375 [Polyangiaceae bacterium]|nr:hypothetical protein [Polyangiaceae bacterium]